MKTTDILYFDYTTFVAMVCALILIPLYTKCKESKNTTKAEFIFASKKISIPAMLMSLGRGCLGVQKMLGAPAEHFYNGTPMFEAIYGLLLAYPITAYFFVPVYYNLGVTSVYEYLDMRFNAPSARSLASGLYILRNIFNTGVTVFSPCVALKAIIGFPYWSSIVGIGTISIVCAMIGGLKAQIMADVLIGLVSYTCMMTIIVKGTIDVGGFEEVMKINSEWGRFIFFNFDFDPEVRVSTISAFFGQLFMSISIFACQQHFVQRYCSMGSLTKVQRTLWVSIPLVGAVHTLFWFAGAVIFANYATCDPRSLSFITKIDEILPFYVDNVFGHIPGIIGIFMGCVFNGSLSVTVGNLNSMATVTWEDFLSKIPPFKNFKDSHQLLAIKILVIWVGAAVIGVAFGVALLPGVLDSSKLVTSATSGPLLGVFMLAMFFPSCNWKGAASGMISSLALTLGLMIGRIIMKKQKVKFLPVTTEGCTNETFNTVTFNESLAGHLIHWTNMSDTYYYSVHNVTQQSIHNLDRTVWDHIFSISYMYYACLGTVFCLFVGLMVSHLTETESDIFDEKLIHPLALRISRCFPGKPRKFLSTSTVKQIEKPITTPVKLKLENFYDGDKFEMTKCK
ncbi:hypothetical protein RUM43_013242 [Polyplax serrata]|uniref:Sodium-coupled monocarboxylate transporter 1 n=1 Tax=Polyplax serrata TaxID=468196 RepID=A0AAN8P379_POLSC